jgi:NDP-sugar pyrophosphorylase family protein
VVIADGSLVGNSCELKNSVLMDRCQIAHFNYIGDSILGIHAHFGAGAITSNFKMDGSAIKVQLWDKSGTKESNLNQKSEKKEAITSNRNKLGAIVGHNVEIGCNAVLNPGSMIGRNSVIYPLTNWRGSLGANKICKLKQEHTIVERKENLD